MTELPAAQPAKTTKTPKKYAVSLRTTADPIIATPHITASQRAALSQMSITSPQLHLAPTDGLNHDAQMIKRSFTRVPKASRLERGRFLRVQQSGPLTRRSEALNAWEKRKAYM